MVKKTAFFFLLLSVGNSNIFSQKLYIGLFYDVAVKSIVVAPAQGSYVIVNDSSSFVPLDDNTILNISLAGDSIQIKDIEGNISFFHTFELKGITGFNSFKLRPVLPSLEVRTFDDNLVIKSKGDRLLILNEVNLESYTAGVVEAEGGSMSHPEYYKSQAVICRTYTLSNLNRHADESFNLCDGVHCQAYKGKCQKNDTIIQSVISTASLVIVHSDTIVINAAFHSNCGGQTSNSEDAWLTGEPYLRSIKDPYCLSSRNASWSKKIPLGDWKKYLAKYGINIDEAYYQNHNVIFSQNSRKQYLSIQNDSLPLKVIRQDMGLRSSFFSVETDGQNIILKGKGYGHGVGLCQEGAMSMAKKGLSFREIIYFYYKDVKIVDLNKMNLFKQPVILDLIRP